MPRVTDTLQESQIPSKEKLRARHLCPQVRETPWAHPPAASSPLKGSWEGGTKLVAAQQGAASQKCSSGGSELCQEPHIRLVGWATDPRSSFSIPVSGALR